MNFFYGDDTLGTIVSVTWHDKTLKESDTIAPGKGPAGVGS